MFSQEQNTSFLDGLEEKTGLVVNQTSRLYSGGRGAMTMQIHVDPAGTNRVKVISSLK